MIIAAPDMIGFLRDGEPGVLAIRLPHIDPAVVLTNSAYAFCSDSGFRTVSNGSYKGLVRVWVQCDGPMDRVASVALVPPDESATVLVQVALPDDDLSYFAQMQRGNTLSHRTWTQLNEKRHRMRLAWDAFFKDYDLMIAPVAQTAAFPHDQKTIRHERTIVVNNKKLPVVDQIFWAGYASITLLPATAAPIGETKEGLPIGVQIIGPQYGDYTTIAFAKLLEKEYRSFVPPPAYG